MEKEQSTKMESDKAVKKAREILNYWYTMEFLSQDNYDDFSDLRKRVKNRKKDVKGKGSDVKKQNSMTDFVFLTPGDSIRDIIHNEAEECAILTEQVSENQKNIEDPDDGLEDCLTGNLTFYIGKLSREKCIQEIALLLSESSDIEQRPEKDETQIACVCLQISPENFFIKGSFQLSPILWAVSQLENYNDSNKNIAECLKAEKYQEDMEKLEEEFFDSSEEVTLESLQKIMNAVDRKYISGHFSSSSSNKTHYEEVYGMYFQVFRDEAARQRGEDETFYGLSHDFYSKDIKLILDHLEEIAEDPNMGKDLLEYILALDPTVIERKKEQRVDLINGDGDLNKYQKVLSELVNIKHSPLGKWPSKYQPALMQQIAVNLAIHNQRDDKNTDSVFSKNGQIFSVNGPPGTGKTTMLKEIVVNNIIERAALLSNYDNPNEAFQTHYFLNEAGKEDKNKVFCQYPKLWNSIIDDRINDYSILVASSNNAAVENVSEELPKKMKTEDLPGEVISFFDPDKLPDELDQRSFTKSNSDKDQTSAGKEYTDIYFTQYASDLLDSKQKNKENSSKDNVSDSDSDSDLESGSDPEKCSEKPSDCENSNKIPSENDLSAWGLVSAPMGRRSNLSDLYYNVLKPLNSDFFAKDTKDKPEATSNLSFYKKIRDQFQQQYNRVASLRNTIEGLCKDLDQKLEAQEEIAQYQWAKEIAENRVSKIIEEYNSSNRDHSFDLHENDKLEQEIKNLIERSQEEEEDALIQEIEQRKRASFIVKIFNRRTYDSRTALADKYHEDAEHARSTTERLQNVYELYRKQKDIIAEHQSCINKLEVKIKKADRDLEDYKIKYKSQNFVLPDKQFVSELFSETSDVSAKAHVANPWFTDIYNREREKLFGLAIRLNREFVICSKAKLKVNFELLALYWGLKTGKTPEGEKKRIIFDQKNKEAMLPSLYQTLFLLIPVMSSTFASVQNMFGDVKDPGVIGMLIVDEAGQAQPQIALGSLYRSRKAVIVGDPKQIEPVVTDELSLVKKAFKIPNEYKDNTISVQTFADTLNCIGAYLPGESEEDPPVWEGCPLLVHRRCISPMFDISNELTYHNAMKQQTVLSDKDMKGLICDRSQWFNVVGKEVGNKNHFVKEQGRKACELLETAFNLNDDPDNGPNIFVISPFTSVKNGFMKYLKGEYLKNKKDSKIDPEKMEKKIGTVHTFQGREAKEVIFLLGCDGTKEAEGAVKWVNNNIVNVAATRAKCRLYIIGSESVWSKSDVVSSAKRILDTFAIKNLQKISTSGLSETDKKKSLEEVIQQMPPVTAFDVSKIAEGEQGEDYSVSTDNFVKELSESLPVATLTSLTEDQLKKFGFKRTDVLNAFSSEVKQYLNLGIWLFSILEAPFQSHPDLDSSCCSILFCKAMELQMRECFTESLKKLLPDFKIRGMGTGRKQINLQDARSNELTLGAFSAIFQDKNNCDKLIKLTCSMDKKYDSEWWQLFQKNLNQFRKTRNDCCHAGCFPWAEQEVLRRYLFFGINPNENEEPKVGGLIFESDVGKLLIS